MGVTVGATGRPTTASKGVSIPTDDDAPKGAAVSNGAVIPQDAVALQCSAAPKDVRPTYSMDAIGLSPKADGTEADAGDVDKEVASGTTKTFGNSCHNLTWNNIIKL